MTPVLSRPVLSRPIATAIGVAMLAIVSSTASAQAPNARFGRWKLKSDAPAPASNIMTYEASGAGGMKVTIESVSAKGDTTRWWYVTDFDGKPSPVSGNPGQTHAAVRRIDAHVNEIINSKDGVVTQRLTNILSPDGNTIAVVYMRDDGQGKTTAVSFATYERMRP